MRRAAKRSETKHCLPASRVRWGGCAACAARLGHGSTAEWALSPAARTISSLGVMSCHWWSLAFRVYFLTDRHSRLMANCVKTRQILTEEPCTGCFSFSTRGCDGDFENENFKGSRRICASFAVHVTARAGRRPARREPDPARVPHRAPTRARRSSTRDPRSRGPGLTRSSHTQPLKKRRGDGGG